MLSKGLLNKLVDTMTWIPLRLSPGKESKNRRGNSNTPVMDITESVSLMAAMIAQGRLGGPRKHRLPLRRKYLPGNGTEGTAVANAAA